MHSGWARGLARQAGAAGRQAHCRPERPTTSSVRSGCSPALHNIHAADAWRWEDGAEQQGQSVRSVTPAYHHTMHSVLQQELQGRPAAGAAQLGQQLCGNTSKQTAKQAERTHRSRCPGG